MAVTFRLDPARATDQLGFAWSPLFELALSMVAVARPKRTPMHLPWSRRCRELLADDDLQRIRELTLWLDGFVPGIFEVGLAGDSANFDDELVAFRRVDDDLVVFDLSYAMGGYTCAAPGRHGPHLVHDPAYRDEIIARAAALDDGRAALARSVFEDPAAVRSRLADLFERYWEAAFAEEWSRILPRIEREVTDGARALVTRGAGGLIDELLPEGRFDEGAATIVVDKTYTADVAVAGRDGLLFVPTVYSWPRVLVEVHEPWPLSIFFPLRDLRQPQVPTAGDREVVDGLRALGDETRLQITRMVAEQPRSTKELAELLQLSDSAISRHLKVLEAAEVVDKQRAGYFVLYGLRPERIGQLGAALRRTLGLAASSAGPVPPLPVSALRPTNR